MNFLKVKKFVFVFCLSFFISIGIVNAETTLGGDVYFTNTSRGDYSSSINLFEDTANFNGFIEFLYNHNNDLVDYLFDYYGLNSIMRFDEYSLSIFTPDDFFWGVKSFSKSSDWTYDITDEDIVDAFFGNDDFNYHNYGVVQKFYNVGRDVNDVDYVIAYSSDINAVINSNDFSLTITPKILFLFNSSGVSVGYIIFGSDSRSSNYSNSNMGSSTIVDLNFTFKFDNDNKDITSWFAYLYKANVDSVYSVYDKIYAFKFHNNGDYFLLDSNAGYSGVQKWFDSWFYDKVDLSVWNMNFVYDDVFYKKGDDFRSLYDYWHIDYSDVVPDDYSSVDVSSYEKGYYFTPVKGCSVKDYKFYYTTDTSVSSYAMYFGFYQFKDNSLINVSNYKVYSSKSYVIYSYQPIEDLGVTTTEYLDYTINIYLNSSRHFYNLYFNSDCYSYDIAASSDIILNFDSGDFTISSEDINDNFQNYTPNGSYSSDVNFGNSNNSSNSNVTNNSADSVVNVSNIIQNIPNYITGFTTSISALVGIVTIFLTGLPIEILSILLAFFIIGLVILIIKLV